MSKEKIKILVLTADPRSLSRLQLGREVREIAHKVWRAEHRDRFEVVSELSVRRGEVIELLLQHHPSVVHFSGHGSKEGAIFLISDDDTYAPVSTEALKAIFTEFKDSVRLVFLNACYTQTEVEAIAEVIDCAVGTQSTVSDRAATAFAASFYSTLAYGRTIGEAFNLGKAQLMTAGWQEEAELKLLARPGVDPYQIRLVDSEGPASHDETESLPKIDTDPTGRVYVSYAPSRISDIRLIACAMRDRGIPLCEEGLAEDLLITERYR